MACQIISCEGAVFVLWGKPTKDDMELVRNRVALMAKTSGRPIVYITRVPVDAPPPDPDVRQRLNEVMPEMKRACSSYHVVLEGVGFVSALKRAILASLMQFGWPRGTFFVHASAKEAVFAVSKEARRDVEAILHMAERQGLLTGPAPVDPELVHHGRSVPAGKGTEPSQRL
jgi:hypothetical protein